MKDELTLKLIERLKRTIAEENQAIAHTASLLPGNRRGGLSKIQKTILFAEIQARADFARILLQIINKATTDKPLLGVCTYPGCSTQVNSALAVCPYHANLLLERSKL